MNESKPAGMWKWRDEFTGPGVVKYESGEIVSFKGFIKIPHECWVLDESPEAIAEATQSARVKELEKDIEFYKNVLGSGRFMVQSKYQNVDDLFSDMVANKAELAKVKSQRDELASHLKLAAETMRQLARYVDTDSDEIDVWEKSIVSCKGTP